MLDLDYATIRAAWDTYPMERVRYAEDETGWAARLDPQHVCLANVPLAENLFQFDICVCPTGEALPPVGAVVQRYYTQRALVRYACLADRAALRAHYRAFAAALRAQDCVLEGMVPGAAQVQARATCDLATVIAEAAAEVADKQHSRMPIYRSRVEVPGARLAAMPNTRPTSTSGCSALS